MEIVRSVDFRRPLSELPGFAVTDTGEMQAVD
jgi:hypothetical protein